MDRVDRLAQLGFIVVTVGNRGGNPSREANGIIIMAMAICATMVLLIRRPQWSNSPTVILTSTSIVLASVVILVAAL